MKITHFGHACVLVETNASRLLIDPGSMSEPQRSSGDIDAILFTHSHIDHLHLPTVQELIHTRMPRTIVADTDSDRVLADADITNVTVADDAAGVKLDVAGVDVVATKVPHATIHCELPHPVNNTYLFDGRLLHPGDAFWYPSQAVDVLLLPIGGPWMKLAEAVDYLRLVAPKVVIPIHQGGLAKPHRDLHSDILSKLSPAGTEFLPLASGESVSL
ncbi:MBL fold metallo-hydrolase [Mycobacterium deserti]|uniref:MBL fold metallo-hydrolase n=1 Tax=Mycobacterium deserti TaxID=2978347 RepID=A0ABT2MGS4_9MYCO|nr:MBL fold metallo-hydrolase [Mycobacterium deserti]MCT7660729.1 MBL fold metallo-hydrolase [Mycobacterium deserti]